MIIGAEYTYRIPRSLLDQLWPRCPSFCERLMLEVDKNGSFHIQTRTAACEVFEIFLFWAAEKRLPCLDGPTDDITEGDISTAEYGFNEIVDILADLWMFAEEFSIPKLQNDAMKKLLEALLEVDVRPFTLSQFHRRREEEALQSVLLLEVAHGLWCGRYTGQEMDAFAKVEGFLELFASLVRGEWELDPKETRPSRHFADGGDISAFMVPET